MRIPVYYEIDVETQEATGTVHPFCSDRCRMLFIAYYIGSVPDGITVKPGINDLDSFPTDTVCENCGEFL